jgi:epoxyqueuosine reductase QueG
MTPDTPNTYEDLRALALSMGVDLFGVADLERVRSDTDLLDSCYNNYIRGVSVGVALDETVLAGIVDGPTLEYSREYQRINWILNSIAEALEERLKKGGADALRIPASEVIDWEKLRGHLSHKLIGRYAGHGWIGKNILLVNPALGSRVRYVTVLTDAPLEPDAPMDIDCGKCSRCVVACPAGAAADDPARFDLQACFNKVAEFNERLDKPHFICGMCIKACRGKKA